MAQYQSTNTRYSLGPFSFTLNTTSISSGAPEADSRRYPSRIRQLNPFGSNWRWLTRSKNSSGRQSARGGAPVAHVPPNGFPAFEAYDKAWQKTSSSPSPEDDATKITWPSIDFTLPALLQRDDLRPPPGFEPPVSLWTGETVITANTHAFFLAAVGISPTYLIDQRTMRVNTGFRKADASIAQVDRLVTMLERERLRWHPDEIDRHLSSGEAKDASHTVFCAICLLLDQALNDSWLL